MSEKHTPGPKTWKCGCYGECIMFCPLHTAAPELLVTLQKIMKRVCSDICSDKHVLECVEARAAIAKATGAA